MPAVDFVEFALEESPRFEGSGTLTPYRIATNLLYMPVQSATIAPNPSHLDRRDELRGLLGAPAMLIDGFAIGGDLNVRAYPQAMTWLLSLSGFKGVFTAGDGTITDPDTSTIPVGASRWVFDKRDAIDAKTATVRINYATENVLLTATGVALSSLGLTAEGEISAAMEGLYYARAAADTSTVPAPVSVAIPPFRRRDLTLTWLTGSGRSQDFSINISNPLVPVNSLGLTTPSFFPDAMEFGDEQTYVTGSIPKRILDADDLDSLMNATTFAATARWQSTKVIGATAYKYTMWLQMPACQHTAGSPGAMGNKRRFGMDTLDWFAAIDPTAGYDARFTIVNDVTAISAPFNLN